MSIATRLTVPILWSQASAGPSHATCDQLVVDARNDSGMHLSPKSLHCRPFVHASGHPALRGCEALAIQVSERAQDPGACRGRHVLNNRRGVRFC
eukprot:scaffold2140_cov394-Prasinococcus_capsulatus_cf.AAC.7